MSANSDRSAISISDATLLLTIVSNKEVSEIEIG